MLIALAATPAVAWDYLTNGSDSIYAGHSTGMLNATGDAAISFSCTKSARGFILFVIESRQPISSEDEEVVVSVKVDGVTFEMQAVSYDGGGFQGATTFSLQAAVTLLARRIQRSSNTVVVTFEGRTLEFEGAAGDTNFVKMFEVCGGGR